MKKKILTVALVVALVAIMVSGTLAYFMSEDKVTNTFTIGSVEIDVKETFEPPEAMLPVVDWENPEKDENYIDKDAWVENIGKNPAYVQLFFAIPTDLDDTGAFVVVDTADPDWTTRTFAGNATFDGVSYNVYKYQYTKELGIGETTGNPITGAYLSHLLDYKDGKFVMNGTVIENYTLGGSIDMYVAAQAIQSEGFGGDYAAALANFPCHPWQQ